MIAIIAILASMLMPALSKARAKAMSISCVNNLKQQGLGIIMYAGDFKGYAPAAPPRPFGVQVANVGWGTADPTQFAFCAQNYMGVDLTPAGKFPNCCLLDPAGNEVTGQERLAYVYATGVWGEIGGSYTWDNCKATESGVANLRLGKNKQRAAIAFCRWFPSTVTPGWSETVKTGSSHDDMGANVLVEDGHVETVIASSWVKLHNGTCVYGPAKAFVVYSGNYEYMSCGVGYRDPSDNGNLKPNYAAFH